MFAAGSRAPPPVPQAEQPEDKMEEDDGDGIDDEDESDEDDESNGEDEEADDDDEVEKYEEVEDDQAGYDADKISETETKEIMDAFDIDQDGEPENDANTSSSRSKRRVTLENPDGSEEERSRRTIFFGNVPIKAVGSRVRIH